MTWNGFIEKTKIFGFKECAGFSYMENRSVMFWMVRLWQEYSGQT
jgi:hypothetical protein